MARNQLHDEVEPEDDRSDPIMELRNVSISFPSRRGESRTLDDVSLRIERGETIGIVGESGSGKSMLASTLNHSVPNPGVVNGEVLFHPEGGDSVDITELGTGRLNGVKWEQIAVVPQGGMHAFNPTTDVRTHFEETLDEHARRREEGMERARELLREANLEPDEVLDAYAEDLSGGQRQRILIALGLLLDPDILVMDEPTSALDLVMKRQVLNLLYRIREEYDITIVFISHDLPTVLAFADRLAIMYAFEIIEVGSPMDLLKNAAHPYTRALMRAVPSLESPVDAVESIEGETPDPVNIPTGCSYHTRCPLATDRCQTEDPELVDVNDEHTAACFYTDEARDEIPLPFGGDGP